MKSILITVLAVVLGMTGVTQAQNSRQALTFGLKGGTYFSVLTGEDNSKSKVFPIGGVTLSYDFMPAWSLETGMEITRKGVYQEDFRLDMQKRSSYSVDNNVNATYLQMPVRAAYKASVGESSNFLFFAGPYFAYGLSGKTNSKVINMQGTATRASTEDLLAEAGYVENQDTFGDGGLKKFDCGVSAGVGYGVSKFDFRFSFDFGLLDINDGFREDKSIRNQSGSLTVGYNF